MSIITELRLDTNMHRIPRGDQERIRVIRARKGQRLIERFAGREITSGDVASEFEIRDEKAVERFVQTLLHVGILRKLRNRSGIPIYKVAKA